jgi:hypothetical protein
MKNSLLHIQPEVLGSTYDNDIRTLQKKFLV